MKGRYKYHVPLKYSRWLWKLNDAFNLNISFTHFNLIYSGETGLQERVVIKSTTNDNYCGRRIQFSVFVSSTPITLHFHTFVDSISYFIAQYQLTNYDLSTSVLTNKNYQDFQITDNIPFVFHKYVVAKHIYYNWNICVFKMFKIYITLKVIMDDKELLYLYHGPDFNADQYSASEIKTFEASSFQVSMLFYGTFSTIKMKFKGYISKEPLKLYETYYVTGSQELINTDLNCAKKPIAICAFNVYVPRSFYVNITLNYFNYVGPNIEYCKYGGLSIYDYVDKNLSEVLLLCQNWICTTSRSSPTRFILSNTQSLYVIFYSYSPYIKIMVNLRINSTSCKGVHLQK